MSDTPRVDKLIQDPINHEFEMLSFARTLERENAKLLKEREELVEMVLELKSGSPDREACKSATALLSKLEEKG